MNLHWLPIPISTDILRTCPYISYFDILRIDLPLVSDIELIQVIGRVDSDNLGLNWLKTHNVCKTMSLHLFLCMIKSMSERICIVK